MNCQLDLVLSDLRLCCSGFLSGTCSRSHLNISAEKQVLNRLFDKDPLLSG